MVMPVPGLLAFVFGFFAFRSRIKGVYFSIITQAMTFAAMLLFFRNETGFGGNNGFTDFKRLLGIPIATPTRMALFVVTGPVLIGFYLMARGSSPASSAACCRPSATPRARAVHRLRPAPVQAVDLDLFGRDVRHRRRALRAAGGHHQPGRDGAGREPSRWRSGPRWAGAAR